MEIGNAMTLLNLNDNFDNNELDRAFRRKSLECHPDRIGGSSELFTSLNDAFNILKDMPDLSDILFTQTMFENHCFQFPETTSSNRFEEVSETVAPMNYTIPITIKDYYYNKGKKVVVLNNNNDKVKLNYFPCDEITYFEYDNIVFKTRVIIDNDSDDYSIDKSKVLVKYVKLSLSDFLHKEEIKIRVFNEEITIGRHKLAGNYITERDFTIIVDNQGFLVKCSELSDDPFKQKIRGILVVKLIVQTEQ